jgi:hypothetical protein
MESFSRASERPAILRPSDFDRKEGRMTRRTGDLGKVAKRLVRIGIAASCRIRYHASTCGTVFRQWRQVRLGWLRTDDSPVFVSKITTKLIAAMQ